MSRILRLGGLVGVAVLGAVATMLAASLLTSTAPRAATRDGSAETTIRRFIATAVERRDIAASFDLVTPELRQGMSEREWASGTIPVVPFAEVDWQAFRLRFSDVTGAVRYYRVHLRSRKPAYGEGEFWIGLAPRAGRWLVAYFAPAAVIGAPSAG